MSDTFGRLAIALGLGLLVGLQRERTDARLAGFRTFPIVALMGALAGLLAASFGGWIVASGMIGLAIVMVGGNLPLLRVGENSPGITTEAAMLVVYALGAYLMVGETAVAVATCGAVAVLLHLKPQMHSFAERIGDRDFTAIMQFALISLVILPVLPDRAYGPFNVLNPFRIWLMVVLIVGISLGGYVIYKLLGDRAGAWATGILGGLISSTATAIGIARQTREQRTPPELAAFVILMASGVVFLRLAILIATNSPRFLRDAAFPLGAMLAVLLAFAWWNYRRRGPTSSAMPAQSNPSELKPALLFGALYAVVLFTVAAANAHLGRHGLYLTAIISGLTDMDAITLSVSHLVAKTEVDADTGWRLILVAALANIAFKAAAIAVLGDRQLRRLAVSGLSAAFAVGVALLVVF